MDWYEINLPKADSSRLWRLYNLVDLGAELNSSQIEVLSRWYSRMTNSEGDKTTEAIFSIEFARAASEADRVDVLRWICSVNGEIPYHAVSHHLFLFRIPTIFSKES